MKRMTVGFIFHHELKKVLLIKKDHPRWQKGLLNGVGGGMELEDKDSYPECWVREVMEETGIKVNMIDAIHMGSISVIQERYNKVDPVRVEIYTYRTAQPFVQKTDEELGWYDVDYISELEMIPNLHFLIPFALEFHNDLMMRLESSIKLIYV